ncbi:MULTISPECIES: hypothetical protein [Nostocales]|uniref:Uncharacterized protein n=3 Tax=Nostocales TaxID=1161 RepID=A0A0C1R4M2_9CYAN|nr:hypothetical protein [Tolypothrix bouteillei]KAF3889262.1 hypothetical protein DA73_0400030100 [Tolypothrix bouteillei VB521301]
MSIVLTFTSNTVVFRQDPRKPSQDTEHASVNVDETNIEFSSIEITDFQGIPFAKHLNLKVHIDGDGIVSNQGNQINTWFISVNDVSQIKCDS